MTQQPESPFDVFNSDSDEEETSESLLDGEAIARAKLLVARASVNKAEVSASAAIAEGEWDKTLPWDAPLFFGPVKIETCRDVGGERGMVAVGEIEAGTLVLVEDPMVRWSSDDDKSIDPDVLELIFSRVLDAQKLIHNAEHLHPTKTAIDLGSPPCSNDVKELVSELQSLYGQDDRIPHLLDKLNASGLANSDGSKITKQDLLRLLLVVRFNGLESGLYCFTAMLNHSDQPNCVKFKGEKFSEVRTTRSVKPGEMLTISYVPRICSHATRRRHLWQQHRFDIGDAVPPDLFQMELVAQHIPPSWTNHIETESVTTRIENTISELEGLLIGMEGSAEPTESLSLEQASLELLQAAEDELSNPHHILFIPILKLHVDSCYVVQRVSSVSSTDRRKLLCRLIASASRLELMLTKLFGGDHFDVASAAMDVAQSLDDLVHRSPQHLVSSHLLGLETIEQYTAVALDAWKRCKRIKALYPKDAHSIIQRKLAAKKRNG